ELVVGDLDIELILRSDGDLHHRQGVDVQVVHEALLRGDLGGRDTGDLVDDLAEALEDLLLGHGHVATTPWFRSLWVASCRAGFSSYGPARRPAVHVFRGSRSLARRR